jgi:hypothetical protein
LRLLADFERIDVDRLGDVITALAREIPSRTSLILLKIIRVVASGVASVLRRQLLRTAVRMGRRGTN